MTRAAAIALLAAGLCACGGAGSDPDAATHTWYVSSTAAAGGDGSARAPFNSLQAVDQASAAGDSIIVLASPISAAPLDGGIALKRGQRLIGDGAPVNAGQPLGAAPQLTNSSKAQHNGDAVVLADDVEVSNLMVVNTARGGIYGNDVRGVVIRGNDVSGHNTSCTQGFYIPPFTAPSNIPGVGVDIATGLTNGWAGIMVDASTVSGHVAIHDNHVHDAGCGDGIDLRVSGSADLQADLTHNVIENLKQGYTLLSLLSLLAMGMQTADHGRLRANLDGNRQTGNGSVNSDSEGVFVQLSGSSELIADIDHNDFSNGTGHFSANGLEFVILGGDGHGVVHVRNSSFTDVPGDVIEAASTGENSRLELVLDHSGALQRHGQHLPVAVQQWRLPAGRDGRQQQHHRRHRARQRAERLRE